MYHAATKILKRNKLVSYIFGLYFIRMHFAGKGEAIARLDIFGLYFIRMHFGCLKNMEAIDPIIRHVLKIITDIMRVGTNKRLPRIADL